jgi:hypothetical protein
MRDFGFREVGRDAGGGDWFAAFDALPHFEIEVEQLLEEVLLGGEAVGGQYGRVECKSGLLNSKDNSTLFQYLGMLLF